MSLKVVLLLSLLVGFMALCMFASYTKRFSLKDAFNLLIDVNSCELDPKAIWGKSIVILLIFITSAVAIDVGVRLLFNYHNELTTFYSSFYFLDMPGDDSWQVMVKALEHFDGLPDETVYEALILKDFTKFQYPPSSLLIFDVPRHLFSLSYPQLIDAMNKLCWLSIPLMAIVFYHIHQKSALSFANLHHKQLDLESYYRPIITPFIALLVGVLAVEMFYPILRSYKIGQIQTIMTLLSGTALLAWQTKRYSFAGVLLSICCSFKPQWVVLVPWAIIRKQWSFLISFSITSLAIFLITNAFYGIRNWFDYAKVLSVIGKLGESYYPNQSVNGLLHRLFMNGNNLEWVGNGFPPYNSFVYIATLASSFFILSFAIMWKRKHQPTTVDLSIVVLSLTIASPIAWEHHYGVSLFLFAIAIPLTIVYKPLGKWSFLYLWVTYLLVSQNYGYMASGLANTYWNFLQSTLFFGIVLLLFYFYRISLKEKKLADNYSNSM